MKESFSKKITSLKNIFRAMRYNPNTYMSAYYLFLGIVFGIITVSYGTSVDDSGRYYIFEKGASRFDLGRSSSIFSIFAFCDRIVIFMLISFTIYTLTTTIKKRDNGLTGINDGLKVCIFSNATMLAYLLYFAVAYSAELRLIPYNDVGLLTIDTASPAGLSYFHIIAVPMLVLILGIVSFATALYKYSKKSISTPLRQDHIGKS